MTTEQESSEFEAQNNSTVEVLNEGVRDREIHFDCSNCNRTVTECSSEQFLKKLCKGCVSEVEFRNAVGQASSATPSSKSHSTRDQLNQSNSTAAAFSNMSPLTTKSDSTPHYNNSNSSGGFIIDDGVFSLSHTHSIAISLKAPKNSSNYAVMNVYQSEHVYCSELEAQVKSENEKRTTKFYMGVDVIYRANRKAFTSYPLLCPAKVYYANEGSTSDEEVSTNFYVIVGIIMDPHSAYPLIAEYDSHGAFKNLKRGKTVIHSLFARLNPSLIEHKFDEEELELFSSLIPKFLSLKTPVEVMEGTKLLNDACIISSHEHIITM